MKSRLAASIYLFSAGTCRNTRNTVPSRSIVTPFDQCHCKTNRSKHAFLRIHTYICKLASFQAQGFESSSRAVHSSALEDDDTFSELGPEVSEYCAKQIKLVTEKPDCFVVCFTDALIDVSISYLEIYVFPFDLKKNHQSRRELDGKPVSSYTRPSIKEIVSTMVGASPTSNSKPGGHSNASTSADDTKKISDVESPRSVLVKNIISEVGLSELVEAISVFGKVSGASFVVASNGLRSCNIEFEDVDSSRRATLAGKIAVGSQVFPVLPLDAVDIVAFRIENINKETTDYTIHSRCKAAGEFVGLARTSKDVVEALLNNTVIDHNRWSAVVLTSESKSSEVSSDEEARYKLGLQIFDHFSELRRQLALKNFAWMIWRL
ncbi:hypothetical protein DH2020_031203 [Rehmannia glutinosa]|uniref:Uncharacterized protein n=1 Tax=Rehmannia glutinosa TaxID=99300 RepID=A0ABR0VLL5_REHGL